MKGYQALSFAALTLLSVMSVGCSHGGNGMFGRRQTTPAAAPPAAHACPCPQPVCVPVAQPVCVPACP